MTNMTVFHQAIRQTVVLKYLGQLSLPLALLSLIPFTITLWFHEYRVTLGFAAVFVCLVILGACGLRLPEADHLQPNEGLAITALAFVLTPLLMAIPMGQGGLSFEDALFESVSAVTTTGLTTVEEVEELPRSILFLRSWMQWYGGLGIIVLSVALLSGQGMISRRLAESENPLENLVSSTRTHARSMLKAYGLLTGCGILGMWALGADGFHGTIHVLSAVSTGGFSSFGSSVAGFDSWIARAFLMILAFCGALALPLYYHIYRKGLLRLFADLEIRGLVIGAMASSTLLLFFLGPPAEITWERVGHAVFIGFSAQTGTGFTTLPIADLDPAGKAALFGSMLVGGSVGSTSGGLKIWRFLIILGLIRSFIHRTCLPPHAVADLRLGGRRIGEEEIHRTLILVGLLGMVVFLSWLPFLAAGYDPLNSLFEVLSATATVGLSTQLTQESLPTALKLILCGDMLLGRLECLAFLVLLTPTTWVPRKGERS